MGKVRPDFSGVDHRGSAAWPVLPRRLRGKIVSAPPKPAPRPRGGR